MTYWVKPRLSDDAAGDRTRNRQTREPSGAASHDPLVSGVTVTDVGIAKRGGSPASPRAISSSAAAARSTGGTVSSGTASSGASRSAWTQASGWIGCAAPAAAADASAVMSETSAATNTHLCRDFARELRSILIRISPPVGRKAVRTPIGRGEYTPKAVRSRREKAGGIRPY